MLSWGSWAWYSTSKCLIPPAQAPILTHPPFLPFCTRNRSIPKPFLPATDFNVTRYLGEEYPEVLGSILGALRSIVTVVGISQMQPPIKDLLPRLTPILRNRHEKVQENTIDLVGRIADRGPESVNAREWMRELLFLLGGTAQDPLFDAPLTCKCR